MKNHAHELFLLSTNLSQFKSKVLITKVFVESMNSMFSDHKFSWSEEIDEKTQNNLKVCTRTKTYGYISFSNTSGFTEETFSLLQNAVQWVAILFEKLEQETLLNNQKEHLNALVVDKTKELFEKQNQLDETSKMAHVGGWEIDYQGNTLSWTSETYRIHELSEQNPPDVADTIKYYHPDDQQMVDNCLQQAINKGESFDFQARLITAKKKERWVKVYGKPTSRNGQKTGVHGMIQDITEQKNAELELVRNQYYLEKAQEIGAMGTWHLDLEKDNLTWTEENYKIFGVENNTPMNLELFLECIHPEDRDYVLAEWNKGIESKTYDIEHRVKANGIIKWIREKAEFITDAKGKVTEAFGVAQDITQKKNDEQQLILAKNKAEEANHLKSAFLANMSHEIRTPMNGILGFTNLLRKPDLTGEQQDKFVKIIQKSGDRMLETVNNIIDISKIDAKQIEMSKSEVNIKQEIESLYEFFRTEAFSKGLELILHCKLPDTQIHTDKTMLDSIMSNLIKNAIKYTDKGSIEIICNKRGSRLDISVRDTGIGIAKEKLQVIFDRFVQADIQDVHARQGSGLGLAITKAYVEMLGGEISIESKSNKGSTFRVTLPWEEKKKKDSDKKENLTALLPALKAINILIAEDDDTSLDHLKIILSASKKISSVKNGKDALAYLKSDKEIHLVLMDMKMPVMDGYEATRQIRKFNKDVVIIAQTAYAFEEDKNKALEAGCNDYISKPINEVELLKIIEKHCCN